MNPIQHNTQKNESPEICLIADEEIELDVQAYHNCCRINVF